MKRLAAAGFWGMAWILGLSGLSELYSQSATTPVSASATKSAPTGIDGRLAALSAPTTPTTGTLSLSSLNAFVYQSGGPAPRTQDVTISTGNIQTGFEARGSSDGWLRVSPSIGTTPQKVTVSANPVGFAPGVYSGTITINAPTAPNPVETLRTTLTVYAAQDIPFGCTFVNQVPPLIRAEGLTELTGDVLLKCTGGTAGVERQLQLSLIAAGTPLTSRRLGFDLEDVVLVVDEPLPNARTLGVNVFQAKMGIESNNVTWDAKVIEPGPGTLTLRIANIRVVAAAFRPTSAVNVRVLLMADGKKVLDNATLVGYVSPSVGIDLRRCDDGAGAVVNLPALGLNQGLLATNGVGRINLNVRFLETFAKAFRTQTQEGGFVVSDADITGKADHGTGLTLQITNIPSVPGGYVRVFVTTGAVTDGGASSPTIQAALVSSASGAFTAIPPTATGACVNSGATSPMAEIPVDQGTATAVWEVTGSDPSATERASFGIAFAYPSTILFERPLVTAVLGPVGVVTILRGIPTFEYGYYLNHQDLQSSRSGLTFIGVTGGASIPLQTLPLPAGTTDLNVTTTDSGNWLTAAISGSSIEVKSDGARAAADYYGQITALSKSGGTLGVFSAVLHLVAQTPGPIVYPQGLIFPAFSGDQQTDPQNILLTNLTSQSITYTQTNPSGSGAIAAGATVPVKMTVNVAGLAPGIYPSSTSFAFSDGTAAQVTIKTIVAPLPGSAACSYSLTPATATLPSSGGTSAVQLQTTAGCPWTVAGLPAWMTANPAAGSGNASIILTAAANPGPPRTASFLTGGTAMKVNQPGGSAISVSLSDFNISTLTSGAGGITIDSKGVIYLAAGGKVQRIANGATTDVAGTGQCGRSPDGPAASTQICASGGIAVDSAGAVYFADASHCVRKVSNGTVTTVAGVCGSSGFSGDGGPATKGQFNTLFGIALDVADTLYVADWGNHRIRRISSGILSTVAGTGTRGTGGVGGPGANAQLDSPFGVAVDANQNLYLTDNSRFLVLANGTLYELADAASAPALTKPYGIAVAQDGTVYVADAFGDQILSWTPSGAPYTGTLTQVAGGQGRGYSGDNGPALNAKLGQPEHIAADAAGNVYFSETINRVIRKLTPAAASCTYSVSPATWNPASTGAMQAFQIQTSAGCPWAVTGLPVWITNTGGTTGAGPATVTLRAAANFGGSQSAQITIAGVAVSVGQAALGSGAAVSFSIGNFAGTGAAGYSGDDGPASGAELNKPVGVAVDAAGTVYIGDTGNKVIRQVLKGTLSTIAGNGRSASDRDGVPAILSGIAFPGLMAVDRAGSLYFPDTRSHCVRKVALTSASTGPTGGLASATISTVAGFCVESGFGYGGFDGDGGPATAAQLNSPIGLAFDAAGNLYIADSFNQRIRKVDLSGIITTVAGGQQSGSIGDGGPATSASLFGPSGVAFDSRGFLYITDSLNNRVRVVANGTIYTIAGNGSPGFAGDGSTTGAAGAGQVDSPLGVVVAANNAVYFADNNRIRRWTPSSAAGAAPNVGTLSTVAGTEIAGNAGDGGPASTAALNQPIGLAIDAAGKIYVADNANNRVRVLTPAIAASSVISQPTTSDAAVELRGAYGAAISASGAPSSAGRAAGDDCVPTRITAVFQQIGYVSVLNVGWSQPIQVKVADSCSRPVTSATVALGFSNQDPARTLQASGSGDGVFVGEWTPARFAASGVTITANITSAELNLSTIEARTIALSNAAPPPVVDESGIVGGASSTAGDLAPGSIITILGTGFAPGSDTATSNPLPDHIGSTKVLLDLVPLPLISVGPGRIDAVLPLDLRLDQQHFLNVQNGFKNSATLHPVIQVSRPGIFTTPPGSGQGAITLNGVLADASAPVQAGDVIAIDCTGLGPVYPFVANGVWAPINPPSNVQNTPVTVTVGGVDARVDFAGLKPGTVGVYQILAAIPDGVPSGGTVPVVVTVGGQASKPATIAVR